MLLTDEILTLFGERGRMLACVSKPLMPLGSDLDVGVLHRGRIFDYAAHAAEGDGIVKLPVGVALKVKTD